MTLLARSAAIFATRVAAGGYAVRAAPESPRKPFPEGQDPQISRSIDAMLSYASINTQRLRRSLGTTIVGATGVRDGRDAEDDPERHDYEPVDEEAEVADLEDGG